MEIHQLFISLFFLFALADCSQAGEGNLEVNVVHNGVNVPAKVMEEGYGIYKVDFVPKGAGIYKVQVMFNGSEVKGEQIIRSRSGLEIWELEVSIQKSETDNGKK